MVAAVPDVGFGTVVRVSHGGVMIVVAFEMLRHEMLPFTYTPRGYSWRT